MCVHSYRSSQPDHWVQPRPHRDASLRRQAYGKVRPMHEPSWFERLLGRA
ncbi:hypothetical protein [Altererythrobacter lutimaris]|uniref:Uncharacterized protein n=1 Tax=Altererythrobacter lutimaris TaxID=2743979 RepID=A0A850H8Q6_9SPHN|nr:hypothetical protein [Altererythrobacter lutimaris]NVE95684.1 hypothetical protein [Altererythrobacter lutimaris]